MTFIVNPIAAPKRTHMAMPAHLAEMAVKIPSPRPNKTIAVQKVDIDAIINDHRKDIESASKAEQRLLKRTLEQKLAKLEETQKRLRERLKLATDYRKHPNRGQRLMRLVAHLYHTNVEVLTAKCRKRDFIKVRHFAMWIVYNNACFSTGRPMGYPSVGRLFGGRDHTTVLSAIQKINNSKALLTQVKELERVVLDMERRAYGGE